jgi:ATP-dependent DNA helicase RecG
MHEPIALDAPVSALPGIGPAAAAILTARGLATVEDLLWFVPRRYDDARAIVPLAELIGAADGDRVALRGRIASARMVFVRRRRWAEVRITDGPHQVLVRWFNVYGGVDKRFPIGASIAISGPVRRRAGRLELANPDVLAVGPAPDLGTGTHAADLDAAAPPRPLDVAARIVPRYPEVRGVAPGRLAGAIGAALAAVGDALDDGVPAAVPGASIAAAVRGLHAPPADLAIDEVAALNAGTHPWQRRLVWGELFVLGAMVAQRRRAQRAVPAPACPRDPALIAALALALPFALPGAQVSAIDELAADLARPTPMNRLLQGNVGAGKTAVAFAAAAQVMRAGHQVALMVPTELVAEQHHATLAAWAAPLGLRTALVTGSLARAERAAVNSAIAAGAIDLVVGTHALAGDGVAFARLGLAIVDEQHRFGVAQRLRLRAQAGSPHLLVMTATPIPRTLALTAYGDLDVTVIDAPPPGRVPPTTQILRGKPGRARAYQRVRERLDAGERAFVVCPLVDESGAAKPRADATAVAAELAALLAPARVGLVHGRLEAPARIAVMRGFAHGDLDVLVATTVVEVGVDVPAATVMVIEDAEGYGLAQLHQLRGRVGRGGGPAWCLLLTRGAAGDGDGDRRLAAVAATTDGFQIAEDDLAMRGPGELFGARQAGVPRLRFGDLRQHTALLLEARAAAEAVIAIDPELVEDAHASLRAALARRAARAEAFGADSG